MLAAPFDLRTAQDGLYETARCYACAEYFQQRMAFLSHPTVLVRRPAGRALISSRRKTRTCRAPWRAQAPMPTSVEDVHMPAELSKLVQSFAAVPDPKLRYQQLLFYARQLPPMNAALKTDENLVHGCQSVVHIHVALDGNGLVTIQGDSDAQLTRGLVAMLVRGFEGATPQQVINVDPSFIAESGLAVSLTPARNNGFANALALVKRKVAELMVSAEHTASQSDDDNAEQRPTYNTILKKLQVLEPISLSIVDESSQHSSHAAMRLRRRETHFAIDIVSDAFESMGLVQRHRVIYTLLKDEMVPGKVHALKIEARTRDESAL